MKRVWGLLLGICLATLVALPASAATTLTPLNTPPAPAGIVNVHWGYCAASGFNSDGSINGVCQYSYGSAQRFHSSATNSYWMTWSASGAIVGLGAQCAHSTGYSTGNWAQPGCARRYQGTGTVVMVNGAPYYYVATDAATGHMIVSSNVISYLAS